GHDADDEASDVVLVVGVEPRHLRGLAAEQRTSIAAARDGKAFDNFDGDVRIQSASGEVIEEEEGLGALDEYVVDAVIDQIDSNRPMDPGQKGDAQLRADPVRAGNQH